MRKLTFDEELALSDALVERRRARRRGAKQQGVSERLVRKSELGSWDRWRWNRGDRAAAELVGAYMPFLEAEAQRVARRHNITRHTVPSSEDLVHEAVVAAFACTWAFNLRSGGGTRRGRRFHTYVVRHVHRCVRRALLREQSLYQVDADVIHATRVYNATVSVLREELGRMPTEEEIQARLIVGGDDKVMPGLPMRSQFMDATDPETNGQWAASTSGDVLVPGMDAESGAEVLRLALREVVDEAVAREVLLYVGVDRGYPRDDLTEMAEALGVSLFHARKAMSRANVVLSHPAYRERLRRSIVRRRKGAVSRG